MLAGFRIRKPHQYPKRLSIHRCIHATDEHARKTQQPCGLQRTLRFRGRGTTILSQTVSCNSETRMLHRHSGFFVVLKRATDTITSRQTVGSFVGIR
jgi:hypothetical protein